MMTNKKIINAVSILSKQGFTAYYKALVDEFVNNTQDNITYSQFSKRTDGATNPLKSEKEVLFYMVAYARAHYLVMRQQFAQSFTIQGDGALDIQVIDYGCGQGIATIALIDYIVELGMADGSHIDLVLIEPSKLSLQIAEYSCQKLAEAHGIELNIQTQNCALFAAKIPVQTSKPQTLHLMSNILDIQSVYKSLPALMSKISAMQGSNIILATSPNYNQAKLGLNELKRLTPYAEITVDEPINIDFDQYSMLHHTWKLYCAKRYILTLSWVSSDINIAQAS